MAYSSIKPKKGKCIDCNDGKEKYLIGRRCEFHYKKYRAEENKNKDRRSRMERHGLIIDVLKTKNPKIIESLDDSFEKGEWFSKKILALSAWPYCMECGKMIPEKFYRHAIAHIFPKAIFLSVATHQYNFLFLGAGCGCHDKTHRIDTFCKMKIWPEAVKRFRLFEPFIKENHKYLTLFKEAI